jgi:large-conductance mechanosensitive channel
VQGIKASILTPLIQAYVIPSNTEERLKFSLRRGEVLELGTFLAELIQWLIFMTLLFLIWKVNSHFVKQNSVKKYRTRMNGIKT